MTVLVTIGPTQEPIDAMRLITNRSTGTLGSLLCITLATAGHRVISLRGTGATADSSELSRAATSIIPFTTTAELGHALERASATEKIDAVFHAAAVSDFFFQEANSGKIPSNEGSITLTLQPTRKLLPLMRDWFPNAVITGWKFEASGSHEDAIASAKSQIAVCRTDACVVNGPSYGRGFGFLGNDGILQHHDTCEQLCHFLAEKLPR